MKHGTITDSISQRNRLLAQHTLVFTGRLEPRLQTRGMEAVFAGGTVETGQLQRLGVQCAVADGTRLDALQLGQDVRPPEQRRVDDGAVLHRQQLDHLQDPSAPASFGHADSAGARHVHVFQWVRGRQRDNEVDGDLVVHERGGDLSRATVSNHCKLVVYACCCYVS